MRYKILDKYFFIETLPPYGIGLIAFTFLLFMGRIYHLMKLVVYEGTPLSFVLKFLIYLIPSFLIFTIPIGLLLAILVSLGRLSSDSEIIALKSSGVSIFQILRPYAFLAILSFFLVNLIVLKGLPWGTRKIKGLIIQMIQETSYFQVAERAFTQVGNHLLFYVESYDPETQKLKNIFIQDSRDPKREITIVAPEGQILKDVKSHLMVIRLINGDIHQMFSLKESYQKLHFTTYDFRVDLAKKLKGRGLMRVKARDLSVSALRERIKKRRKKGEDISHEEIELHKKFALPFTCLIFTLIGVPLGIQPKRSKRSAGLLICLFVVFAYYGLTILFDVMGNNKTLSPFWAVWLPNIIVALVGFYLIWISYLERTPRVFEYLGSQWIRFKLWLQEKRS
ncbi:MAG: LPS export ABC transporter permease LptF [Deltaproteobacteria bacterium]|nr:MAG: LPS export ABC transporter permease LptF [Deltaproteobacteria bacterium]